jgi:hypothetical protein
MKIFSTKESAYSNSTMLNIDSDANLSFYTVFNNSESIVESSSTSYLPLISGNFYYSSKIYSTKFKVVLRGKTISGTGSIRVTISDGTNSVSSVILGINSESKVYESMLDCKIINDNSILNILIEYISLTDSINIDRIKVLGTPSNSLMIESLINTTDIIEFDSKNETLLNSGLFLSNIFKGMASNRFMFVFGTEIPVGVTQAQLKIKIGGSELGIDVYNENTVVMTPSSTLSVGYLQYPRTPDPTLSYNIFGKVLEGSGVVKLKFFELFIES